MLNPTEQEPIELRVRFKGEQQSTFFYVSIKNAERLGLHSLNKIEDMKLKLKKELIDAMQENKFCELIILDYDEDDDNIFEEKELVLRAESIEFFDL